MRNEPLTFAVKTRFVLLLSQLGCSPHIPPWQRCPSGSLSLRGINRLLMCGHAGRGGLPQESNLRRGQGVGLVDEVAEGALQVQGFGARARAGAMVRVYSSRNQWTPAAVRDCFLPRMRFTSA